MIKSKFCFLIKKKHLRNFWFSGILSSLLKCKKFFKIGPTKFRFLKYKARKLHFRKYKKVPFPEI